MIRIAVIGANGQAGRHIVAEALARGFEVTAFVRGSTAPAAQHVVHKDVLAIEQSDLAGFDAVVDALGFWTPDTLPLHVKTALHLADLLSGTKTRLLIVGGAGSLYMDAAHTQQLGAICARRRRIYNQCGRQKRCELCRLRRCGRRPHCQRLAHSGARFSSRIVMLHALAADIPSAAARFF